jgi:hypothetical protein
MLASLGWAGRAGPCRLLAAQAVSQLERLIE